MRAKAGWISHAALAVVCVSLVLYLNCRKVGGALFPAWTADELGYLANAAYLAGKPLASPLVIPTFNPGWSLVLAPLYHLGLSAGQTYHAAVALTAVVGVLLLVPLYLTGRRLGLPVSISLIAATLITIAPAHVGQADACIAENFLTFLVALSAWAAVRYVGRPTIGGGLILATVAGLAFATHARAIAVPCAAIALVIAMQVAKIGRLRTHITTAVATSVCALGAYNLFRTVSTHVYATATREQDFWNSLGNLSVAGLARELAGQSWYQVVAWCAMTCLGGVLTVVLFRGRGSRQLRLFSVWVWSMALLGGAISVVYMSDTSSWARIDQWIYGRYNDCFTAMVCFFALALLYVLRPGQHVAIATGGISAAIAAVFLFAVRPTNPTTVTMGPFPFNIAGVSQWNWTGANNSPAPWLVASTSLALIWIAAIPSLNTTRRWVAFTGAVALFFSVSSFVALDHASIYHSDARPTPAWYLAAGRLGLPSLTVIEANNPSMAEVSTQAAVMLAPTPVYITTGDATGDSPAVLAPPGWEGATHGALCLLGSGHPYSEAIWIMPGDLQRTLLAGGQLTPTCGLG